MAFIFPSNPNIGDLVSNPSSGQVFRWNGFAWAGDPANALISASYAFTASYVLGGGGSSVSASYSDTASYAFYAVSASHEIVYETSSSYADTASIAISSSNALTASYLLGTVTSASYSDSSSIAISSSNALTASYFLTSSVTSASLAQTASYFFTSSVTSASYALTASHVLNTKDVGFSKEWHVSDNSGSDVTGNGSLSQPFKTLGKAFATVGGTGEQIVVHPGLYLEASAILTQPNITICGANGNTGGIAYMNGEVTIAPANSSTRISGILFNNLVHSGSAGLYLDKVYVKANYTKIGTGYSEIVNTDLQASGSLSFRGGTTVIQGDKQGRIQVSGSAVVLVKDSISLVAPSVAGGTLVISDSQVYPLASGSAAVTSAAGTVVYLFNSQITTATGVPERLSIGGFLGYDDVQFNKALSTLGTPLNLRTNFQSLDANLLTATGSLFGTASWAQNFLTSSVTSASLADTASFARTASFVATASYVFNLQEVTTAGNQTSQSISISASLSQGSGSIALGFGSHAEGANTTAIGSGSHAEGNRTTANGDYSHTEGNQTRTINTYAHAEGEQTTARGVASHAEGLSTTSYGTHSHAEGEDTVAVGRASHAEGQNTTAVGNWSHTEGLGTIARKNYQHTEGQYNLENTEALWIVGNGISNASRSNLIAAYTDKLTITGSLIARTITGSLQGTASWALSASWAPSNGGTSQGVAYQTAQSGALYDVSFNSGSTNWTTRSIGGAFQPGDINVLNGFQPIAGGVLAPNTLIRYYRLLNTGSSDNVQQGGTGQINNYSNTDRGFVILVDYSHPTINTFKGAATSSVETALFNANPNMPGIYNSASLVAATGSIYYATDLQRYRVLKNKALGWEDLVPTGSTSASASYAQTASIAYNANTASVFIMSNYLINNYVDDVAAAAGGVPLGGAYRNGNLLLVRIS